MTINERIDKMIGSRDEQRERVARMELSDRINSNRKYEKMRAELIKIAEEYGEELLATTIIKCGRTGEGVTSNGRKFVWEGNNGACERSRYCGSLWIDGIGTVFTSGTISKVVEYIVKN